MNTRGHQVGKLINQLPAATEAALSAWIPVESSNLSRVRYTTTLQVEFKNGGVYEYQCEPDVFEALLASDSKGKYFNSQIKGKFPWRPLVPAWNAA